MMDGRMSFATRLAGGAAFAACLTLAALSLAGCGEDARHPAEEAAAEDVSAEAATVNGQIIYVADVELDADA